LVNIITNPTLNFVLLFIQHFGFSEYYYFFLIPLEVLAVIAEWKMLEYAAGKPRQNLLPLSLLMNGISFAVGLLL
jgi:hypothetical protein